MFVIFTKHHVKVCDFAYLIIYFLVADFDFWYVLSYMFVMHTVQTFVPAKNDIFIY